MPRISQAKVTKIIEKDCGRSQTRVPGVECVNPGYRLFFSTLPTQTLTSFPATQTPLNKILSEEYKTLIYVLRMDSMLSSLSVNFFVTFSGTSARARKRNVVLLNFSHAPMKPIEPYL